MNYKSNINKDLEIVESTRDIVYCKKDLLNKFESFINCSGFRIDKWIKKDNVPYEVLLTNNKGDIFRIVVYLKNISSAGWNEKPYMKRVQVNNVRIVSPDSFIYTEQAQTFMILGYYDFDNNPIMVGWNAYKYVMHKTLRSCYVGIENLLEGYKNGYHKCIISKQMVWIFTSSNFELFLEDYIKTNKIED